MELPVDIAQNAQSLGAQVISCNTSEDLASALKTSSEFKTTSVIVVKNDRYEGVPGYDSWWDVPIAEVSESPEVRQVRQEWEQQRQKERFFWPRDTK